MLATHKDTEFALRIEFLSTTFVLSLLFLKYSDILSGAYSKWFSNVSISTSQCLTGRHIPSDYGSVRTPRDQTVCGRQSFSLLTHSRRALGRRDIARLGLT